MIPLRMELTLALGCVLAGILALGPRRATRELLEGVRTLRSGLRRALAAGALLLGAMVWLSAWTLPHLRYGISALASTIAFAGLWLVALRLEPGDRLLRRVVAAPGWVVGLLALLAALTAQQLVLGNIPHTSDEVAYQFQARAYAQLRLGFPPPVPMEPFAFVHLTTDGGIWHGIMNPGWPLILAGGYALGLPWLVGPLLAGLTLPVLQGFLRRAGAAPAVSGLTLWALALSPFTVFMAATYLAHTASLFLFAVFLWGWVVAFEERRALGGMVAGLALALGILVRPLDALVVSLPFGLLLAWQAIRQPRWIPVLLILGGIGAGGVAGTLLYNRALTGDPFEFPQTRYFAHRFPGQSFGLGFGPHMGSRAHGPEWPGYEPADAPRVTSQRLLHFLRDLWGLPWLTAAVLLLALARGGSPLALRALAASALALLAAYLAHFYHGLAFGSRHYFLATPAAALGLASVLARGLAADAAARRRTAAATLAWAATALVFAAPPRVIEYGDAYRSASASVRRAVEAAGLGRALVLVAPGQWAWKSAFPLNEHPLERSRVLFARDLPSSREALLAAHPGRELWRLTRHRDDSVTLERLEVPGPSGLPGEASGKNQPQHPQRRP